MHTPAPCGTATSAASLTSPVSLGMPVWELRVQLLDGGTSSHGGYRSYFLDLVNVGTGPAYEAKAELVAPDERGDYSAFIRPMPRDQGQRDHSEVVGPGDYLRLPVRVEKEYMHPTYPGDDFAPPGIGLKVEYRALSKLERLRNAGPFLIVDDSAVHVTTP